MGEYIDLAIPCNNKGKESIALIFYLLAREVLYLRRGPLSRSEDWHVMVDSFFWRDPDELMEKEEEAAKWEDAAPAAAAAAGAGGEAGGANWGDEWDQPAQDGDNWGTAGADTQGW